MFMFVHVDSNQKSGKEKITIRNMQENSTSLLALYTLLEKRPLFWNGNYLCGRWREEDEKELWI